MKQKERKQLAEKIAKCEYVIQFSKDEVAIEAAKMKIMQLSSSVHDFEDLNLIDEMVQEILAKMS